MSLDEVEGGRSVHTKPENWEKLRDRRYRHALAMAQFKRFVPFQISALRKQKQWSQQQLADSAELTQGVVSRAENPDYGNLAVNTILRIAKGLDRVFVGQFMSYAEFEHWRRNLSEDMVVLDFEQEDTQFEREAESVHIVRKKVPLCVDVLNDGELSVPYVCDKGPKEQPKQ